MRELTVLVLAAGKGTRMKTALPKVLHPLAGRTLIGHVLTTATALSPVRVVVVLADGMDDVAREVRAVVPEARIVVQEPQQGTGHAVMVAREALGDSGTVLVLYGDTPLTSRVTLERLIAAQDGMAAAVLGIRPPDSRGYGRLRFEGERLVAIVEERHADEELKRDGLCNAGIMALAADRLAVLLDALPLREEKGEYYLTDLVEHARARGWPCSAIEGPWEDGIGINSQDQRAEAEAILQDRLRRRAMDSGVIMIAPATVYLAADTWLAPDVLIEPHVVIGPGVRVGRGARILAFCHIEGAVIGEGARVGPFARLRPGTTIGAQAHIGNFVEAKSTALGDGAKANHLSYLGDATVGAGANIGAGTITCNYDGFAKHRTTIGEGAFIGSNAALVAPVTVGAGAIVGAGSVIALDVPDDAVAVTRSDQQTRPGAARRYRDRRAKGKQTR
jgi:bifunctional UDP-N-acetylglucosamine pyrophosphorylase / glucosamine-1-phosphate N-acetyltransferase